MFRAGILSFFLAFLITTPQAFSDPAADVSLSKNKINAAETAELKIQFQWPKSEASYTFAVPELPLQNLTVSNQAESQETFLKDGQEWTRKEFIFDLSPKGTGEGVIGDFPIIFVNPAGGVQGQYAVSSLKLQISKAPVKRNILPYVFVLGGIAAGFLAVSLFFKKKPAKTPEVPAQVKAVLDIKGRIQTAQVSQENAVINIGREFREVLKEIYDISIRGSESDIVAALKGKNVPADEVKFIERTLNQIREVKYTGQNLSDLDFQILKKEITTFIDSKQILSFSPVH